MEYGIEGLEPEYCPDCGSLASVAMISILIIGILTIVILIILEGQRITDARNWQLLADTWTSDRAEVVMLCRRYDGLELARGA